MPTHNIERRIRHAGTLIVAGLILQVFTLFSTHPLSFMAFLLIACPLIAAGILLFLSALVSHDAQPKSPASQ